MLQDEQGSGLEIDTGSEQCPFHYWEGRSKLNRVPMLERAGFYSSDTTSEVCQTDQRQRENHG